MLKHKFPESLKTHWNTLFIYIMNCLIRNTFTFIVCLTLFSMFPKAEYVVKHYQRKFRLKLFGSLTNDEEVLFTGKGKTILTAVNQCSAFCRDDRHCRGMELCKITEDRIRCQIYCKTKMEENGTLSNNTDRCRYMTVVRYDFLLTTLNYYDFMFKWNRKYDWR